MRTTLYTKTSDYRSKEYDLKTEILDIDGIRYARKTAVFNEGRAHLSKIRKYAAQLQAIMEPDYGVSAVQEDGEALLFEYCAGQSYEEILMNAVQTKDMTQVETIVASYYKLIYKMKSPGSFEVTDRFAEVFGQFEDDKQSSLDYAAFSDVDIIFENIIKRERPYIIDYEWCFEFPIPLIYIFWRGLFVSKAFSTLSDEEKEKIYTQYDLTPELREKFLEMETSFINHTKGNRLSFAQESSKIELPVFKYDSLKWEGLSYPAKFFAIRDGKAEEIYTGITYPGHNTIEFYVDENYERLELFFAPVLSVISDIEVAAADNSDWVDIDFDTTSEVDQMERKFFLKNTPVIIIREKYSHIKIDFYVDIWHAETLDDENLTEYLEGIQYVCKRVQDELNECRRRLGETELELEGVRSERDAFKTEYENMMATLRRKNVLKATETFIKLRKN